MNARPRCERACEIHVRSTTVVSAFTVLFLIFLSVAAPASGEPDVSIPNGSFEQGADHPRGWVLEGNGQWRETGHTGSRCVSVTGNGSDSSYWRLESMPLEPETVYRVTFYAKADSTEGCIISGSTFANRDFNAGREWEKKSWIFKTPRSVQNGYIRFGQWHVTGTVWIDDVSFSRVQPVHLLRDGLRLGVGESIEDGAYAYSSRLSAESSNYSRPCVEHTCGFNSTRWTMSDGSHIGYRFHVPGYSQKSGRLSLTIGYYRSGGAAVEVRAGDTWQSLGTFEEPGEHTVELPSDLFPADAVEVKLTGTGTFQIDQVRYRAPLTDDPPAVRGNTWFLDTATTSPDMDVHVQSLGTLLPGGENIVELRLSPADDRSADILARLEIQPQEGEKQVAEKLASLTDETTVRIPYEIRSAGSGNLTLSVTDRKSGQTIYRAESSFLVPPLYAADFGQRLEGNTSCTLWWCGPTYKVSRERPVPSERTAKVSITAARGEYEPFQLVLRPEKDLKEVKVQPADFTNGHGNTIPADNIRVERVGYVPVTVPTDALGCVGDWPDPLPPWEDGVDVQSGTNQPVWVTVKVPRDAAAGDYKGTIRLVPENSRPMSAAVELHVYDFEIPEETHVRTQMNLSRGPIRTYHNLETAEEMERVFYLYNKNMAEHRVSNFHVMQDHRPQVSFAGVKWHGGNRVQKESHKGKKSLLIVDEDTNRTVDASTAELLPVEPGKKYRFSWAAKAEAGHNYMISVNQYTEDEQWISGNNIDLVREATGEWETESLVLDDQFNPRARYVRINLRPTRWTEDGRHTGRAYFDEIVLRTLPDGPNLVAEPGFESGPSDRDLEVDFAEFDRAGEKYLDDLGFNVFSLPLYGFGGGTFHSHHAGEILGYEQGTEEYMALFSQYCRQVVDHLKAKGWYDEHCVYWFDEPAPDDYDFVRQGMKDLHEADPRLRRMLTEQPEEELYGYVDIWMPVLSRYDHETAQARRKEGDEIWWYICTGPKTPYPNNFIDHPAIEPRIWFWMTWENDVTGCHIWRLNYWHGRLVYQDELQNPYDDPMSYVSGYGREPGFVGYWGNGDGRIIYPPNRHPNENDRKYLSGPVNSVRWELIREGIEDYEYFWLLHKKIEMLEQEGTHADLVREARKLLDVPEDIVKDLTHFTGDPQKLQNYRDRIARMIERISKAR